MPSVHIDKYLGAPQDAVWQIISDIAKYPTFMPSVNQVEVMDGNKLDKTVSRWNVTLRQSIMEWIEEDHYDSENHRIEFFQQEGDLKTFEGYWQLSPALDGTAVHLAIRFDLGIPALADFLDPIATEAIEENATSMLHAIEGRI